MRQYEPEWVQRGEPVWMQSEEQLLEDYYEELAAEMRRARALVLQAQRDSDALQEVGPSRSSAFARQSVLELRTG